MTMGIFPDLDEDAIYLSRTDESHPLSAFSAFPFLLDQTLWATVEHYYQAMKFENAAHQEKIRAAESPAQARKLGSTRFRKIRKDWKEIKVVVMTRAVYTQSKTHAEVASALIETNEHRIVENSQYDYFWGCGRDRRGKNAFGQVLMNVRAKIKSEEAVD